MSRLTFIQYLLKKVSSLVTNFTSTVMVLAEGKIVYGFNISMSISCTKLFAFLQLLEKLFLLSSNKGFIKIVCFPLDKLLVEILIYF